MVTGSRVRIGVHNAAQPVTAVAVAQLVDNRAARARAHQRQDIPHLVISKRFALLKTSYTVIGKYERDETKPSIEVSKNIPKHLDTTVGYLIGESEDSDLLKDPAMLKRLNELGSLPQHDREYILYALTDCSGTQGLGLFRYNKPVKPGRCRALQVGVSFNNQDLGKL